MLVRLNPNQNPIYVDISTGNNAPRMSVVTTTGPNFNAAYGQVVAADPTAQNVIVQLPSASSVTSTGSNIISVVNNSDSSNQVIITPALGDTINNATQFVLAARESIMLVSDSVSEWLPF